MPRTDWIEIAYKIRPDHTDEYTILVPKKEVVLIKNNTNGTYAAILLSNDNFEIRPKESHESLKRRLTQDDPE